jgi:hypothetical protein
MVVSVPSRRLVMLLRTISSQLPLPVPKKWQLTCKTRSGFLDDSIVKPIKAMSNHLTREEWFTCLSEIISLESEASDGGKTGDFITWESFNAGCLLYCKERKNELEARGGISSEGVNSTVPSIAHVVPKLDVHEILVSTMYESHDELKGETGVVVVLCTHCSVDRLSQVRTLATSWKRKIVVSLYLPTNTTHSNCSKKEMKWRKEMNQLVVEFPVAFIIINPSTEDTANNNNGAYPINCLRNFSIHYARSFHINGPSASSTSLWGFNLDVDFVASIDLHEVLLQAAISITGTATAKQTALIVPAFECDSYSSFSFTYTIANLQSNWKRKKLAPFQHAQCPDAHGPTDYEKWIRTSISGDTRMYGVRYQAKYEPYVAICLWDSSSSGSSTEDHHTVVEWFDQRFTGYGYNKMIFVASLEYFHQYQFIVCSGGYVLSEHHPPSNECRLLLNNIKKRVEKRSLYDSAVKDLQQNNKAKNT